MRITDTISYRNLLEGVGALNERLELASEQVASGKKLLHLHDSPADSSEMLQLKIETSQLDQYQTNADSAGFFLQMSDSSLSALYNLVTSIYTQGSAAANNFNDANAMASYRAEIQSQLDQAVSLANTQVRGRYIFAGSEVTAPAFTVSGGTVTYEGDNQVNTIDVGQGSLVRQNVPGSDAFSAVFSAVTSLLTAIDNGDQAGIQSALSQFSGALSQVNQVRAQIGVDLSRVQNSGLARQEEQTNIQTRQVQIGAADLAAALTEVNQVQTALKATLAVGSVIGQQNLFDYLA